MEGRPDVIMNVNTSTVSLQKGKTLPKSVFFSQIHETFCYEANMRKRENNLF